MRSRQNLFFLSRWIAKSHFVECFEHLRVRFLRTIRRFRSSRQKGSRVCAVPDKTGEKQVIRYDVHIWDMNSGEMKLLCPRASGEAVRDLLATWDPSEQGSVLFYWPSGAATPAPLSLASRAQMESFGKMDRFRMRHAKKRQAFMKMPKYVRFRCMSGGNEFQALDYYFVSIGRHERVDDIAPWDPAFEINPFPGHKLTDESRTV